MIRRSVLAAAAMVVLGSVPAARADEYTTFQPLWVEATRPAGGAGCAGAALLNLPSGWNPGDAVVVLLTGSPVADPLRHPLVAALLHERSAVLEIVSAPGSCCMPNGAEDSDASVPVDPIADMLGALRAATRDAGAGLVVGIGYGPGAAVALEALREDVATRHLGADAPRYAAGVAIGDGAARFELGPRAEARQQAPARLGLLCEALGQAIGGLDAARNAAHSPIAEACRVAFVGRQAAKIEPTVQLGAAR